MIYVTNLTTERVNGKVVNLVTPVSSARAKVMDLKHVRKQILANKIKHIYLWFSLPLTEYLPYFVGPFEEEFLYSFVSRRI
jgi:hypothetical protein